MFNRRTSTPSRINSIALQSKKKSKQIQTDSNETSAKSINKSNTFFDNILIQGKNMNDNEFEEFIRVHASNCYWKLLAERTRLQLEDQLRDNRQLHELLDELIKENEQLQIKNEQCEYLTNVFNSIISEYDSGIELHITDESPGLKRQKKHLS